MNHQNSLNGNKKKFFYSACIIKEHIIIIKLIGKIFNLTTCSPELFAFAVVLSIVVPITGAIVVVVVVVGTCVVVVVGSSIVVVEAEDILNLN